MRFWNQVMSDLLFRLEEVWRRRGGRNMADGEEGGITLVRVSGGSLEGCRGVESAGHRPC
jgi:hypothetical protein